MDSTIVIYGSSTGTCEAIAEKIASKLGCKALNVQDLTADIVAANKNLILGTSTSKAGTGTLPPNISLEITELPKSFCYFNFSSYLCRQM